MICCEEPGSHHGHCGLAADLGLGKYEAAFRENEIDETVLPSLTPEDLKELGVTALGHRLKLLDAIAALRSDASGKAPSVDAASTSNAPSAHPEDRAERRQVTVMFSDLVGLPHCRRTWTLKTCTRSFRLIRSASRPALRQSHSAHRDQFMPERSVELPSAPALALGSRQSTTSAYHLQC